jgi:hypothetical protein
VQGRAFSLVSAVVLFVGVNSESFAQNNSEQQRASAVIPIILGGTRFAIPSDWVGKFSTVNRGRIPSFEIIAPRKTMQLPANIKRLEIPKLKSLLVSEFPGEPASEQLTAVKKSVENSKESRQQDVDGYWNWQRNSYVLTAKPSNRPFDQPLVVSCFEIRKDEKICSSSFFWNRKVTVRYDFYLTEVPKDKWADLDERVVKFVAELEASQH